MFIFLYGNDTFRSRQHLNKMVEKFKIDRDPQGLNVARLDVVNSEYSEILQQILAMPFLAERRMIVLENLLVSKQKELIAEIMDRIKNKKIPEENVIVFWEGTDKFLKDAQEVFSFLAKEKFTQKFDILAGVSLSSWIKNELSEIGGKINQSALDYLVLNIGDDMWRLHHLLLQLSSFKGNDEIQISDVEKFLDKKADDNIFNLVDAIVAKQPKKVYQMIRKQYENGEDVQYIFAMILRQIRILLELRDLYERDSNLNSGEVAQKLKLHPFVVKKSLPIIKQYTLEQLKTIYKNLLEIDIKTKTGYGSQSVALDVLVSKITLV